MIRKKLFIKRIDSGIDSSRLDQNVITISIILQHSYDPPNLPLNTLQPIHQLLPLRLRAIRMLRTTTGTDRSLRHIIIILHRPTSFLKYTQNTYPKYPHGVYLLCL